MSQPKKPLGTAGRASTQKESILKPSLPKPNTPKVKSCATCANLLRFDADKAQLHCGLSYFSAPPLERVIRRREAYPVVQADGGCERHRAVG